MKLPLFKDCLLISSPSEQKNSIIFTFRQTGNDLFHFVHWINFTSVFGKWSNTDPFAFFNSSNGGHSRQFGRRFFIKRCKRFCIVQPSSPKHIGITDYNRTKRIKSFAFNCSQSFTFFPRFIQHKHTLTIQSEKSTDYYRTDHIMQIQDNIKIEFQQCRDKFQQPDKPFFSPLCINTDNLHIRWTIHKQGHQKSLSQNSKGIFRISFGGRINDRHCHSDIAYSRESYY